ncbi:tetratricopeptide repeat protein [Henriciella sp.]|uniref:tetratricopeptide repeat protein n=1 Tax=Henriciella sp. TaxID=1968823 RepID=UPI002632B830|nr:tetratricopeptide repeat protein [Henriciella sp.]
MASKPVDDQAGRGWKALVVSGTGLFRSGDLTGAARMFRRAIRLRPYEPRTHYQLASILLRDGKAHEASRIFREATRLAPRMAESWHGLGLALHASGDGRAALSAFRTCVRIDAGIWRAWQSIADITPSEHERISALKMARQHLGKLASQPTAGPAKLVYYADALADMLDFEEVARLIAARAEAFPDRATASERHARALYNTGNYQGAFRQMTSALAATRPCPASGPDLDTPAALDVLDEVCTVLSRAGLAAFPASGTLLGLVRDGHLLAHDRDVDIGILQAGAQRPDLARFIRRHPGLMLERRARPGDRYFALTCRGIAVDLFVYTRRGDHTLCGFSDLPGDIQWRFAKFSLREACFGQLTCTIPADPRRYLAESYGPGWTRQDTGFASAISSPALFETDPFARAFYSAGRARAAIRAGDTAKARALIHQSPIPIILQGERTHEMNT